MGHTLGIRDGLTLFISFCQMFEYIVPIDILKGIYAKFQVIRGFSQKNTG